MRKKIYQFKQTKSLEVQKKKTHLLLKFLNKAKALKEKSKETLIYSFLQSDIWKRFSIQMPGVTGSHRVLLQ